MNPVEKALELRKSVHIRSKEPDVSFSKRLRRPKEILTAVERYSSENGLLAEARRQYIVSLCAAFEIYWRDLLKILVGCLESRQIDTRRLRCHRFTFSELQKILGQRLTLGELVSNSYTFQGTDVVDQVCQDVFGIELFAKMSKSKFTLIVKSEDGLIRPFVIPGTKVLQDRCQIDRCFEIRHETVHNTGTLYRPSRKATQKFEGAMRTFNMFSALAIESSLFGETDRVRPA